MVDNWLEPGGGLPAHYHPLQEERWSVVEGRVLFRHGEEEREIGPEDGEIEEAAQAGEEGLFTPRGLPRGLEGARWAAGFLARYREETVFLSPPQFVQRLLIALGVPSAVAAPRGPLDDGLSVPDRKEAR